MMNSALKMTSFAFKMMSLKMIKFCIQTIYRALFQMDGDNSGEVDVEEFLEW